MRRPYLLLLASIACDAGHDPSDLPRLTSLPIASCPASGTGAIVAPAGCFVFTPADAGAVHGDVTTKHIALEPAGTPTGKLVVHLVASLSEPTRQIASASQNIYTAAALEGHHVIALAYRNDLVLGAPNACGNAASCYPATRDSILRGVAFDGAANGVANIHEDEGIIARLDAALALLAAQRPGHGWDAYRDLDGGTAEDRIVWPDVIAMGHSQGGGHAAWLGRSLPVARVVQLAATCDEVNGAAAPWTFADATWATAPASSYYGLASADDRAVCPAHAAVWTAMGLDPSRRFDDAARCNGGTHLGPVMCKNNFERWRQLVR